MGNYKIFKSIQELIDEGKLTDKHLRKTRLVVVDLEREFAVNIKDLSGLDKFTKLKELSIKDVDYFNLSEIKKIKKLESLTVTESQNLSFFDFDISVDKLTVLFSTIGERSLKFLEHFKDTKSLELMYIHLGTISFDGGESELQYIKNIRRIENLRLSSIKVKIHNVDFVNKETIEILNLGAGVVGLKGIEECKKLRAIGVSEEYYTKVFGELPESGITTLLEDRIQAAKEYEYKLAHLKNSDELRGSASIMDTGLFDFKIK